MDKPTNIEDVKPGDWVRLFADSKKWHRVQEVTVTTVETVSETTRKKATRVTLWGPPDLFHSNTAGTVVYVRGE